MSDATFHKTEAVIEAEKAEARAQRDLWSKVQSATTGFNQDLAGLYAYERENKFKRSTLGRLPGDEANQIRFFTSKVPNMMKSTLAGGKPMYDEKDFIIIIPPGMERDLTVIQEMTAYYVYRFGKEYNSWKAGNALYADGTPLADWSEMKDEKNVVFDFERIGIKTVEQLVLSSDSVASAIGHYHTWKDRATKFLEERKKTEDERRVEEALKKVRAEHEAQLAALSAEFEKRFEAKIKQLEVVSSSKKDRAETK